MQVAYQFKPDQLDEMMIASAKTVQKDLKKPFFVDLQSFS